jgi:MYXO-CTERM domain-containing protein
MILELLLWGAIAAARPPVILDDPAGNYCLATGYCRAADTPQPASGVMFLAVGLVAAGAVALRRERVTPRR